jgi:predicted TIM-barrel fold metal-dependent hydrolase
MGFIDADAHVDETEETWTYTSSAEERYKPVLLDPPGIGGFRAGKENHHKLLVTAGNTRLQRYHGHSGTSDESRELRDVPARLRHMDELGVEIQVIYPSALLYPIQPRPEVEAAVHGAYNRWLADKTSGTGGRLRWAYLPPILSMDKAVAELEWAKENGACAVFKKGVEYDRAASHPYFYPLYAEAERLGLPICFHTSPHTYVSDIGETVPFLHLTPISAFMSLAGDGVPQMFPRLRWGFIEAGVSWVPYTLKEIRRTSQHGPDFDSTFVKANRFFVAADTEDELAPLVERYGGADWLMMATDYGHLAREINAHQVVVDRGKNGELPADVVDCIVSENARQLYGL